MMSVAHGEPRLVVNITEQDNSTPAVEYVAGTRGISRISMQVVFTGYTSVNVQLRGSLDGSTFSDVPGMAISSSGDIVTQEIGPLNEIDILVAATLSGGADSLQVFLMEVIAPR